MSGIRGRIAAARERDLVLAMLVAGGALRLVLAFATYGDTYDIGSHTLVEAALRHDPLHVYALMRWPYPPGFFPELLVSGAAARGMGLPFHGVVQVWAIAADLALALVVADVLRRRGAGRTARLVAVASIALGPLFIEVSGYHGQIDAAAILPAVLAVWVWERGGDRRALAAGLLIGLGAATKTVPGVVVLALLPTVVSRREAVTLIGAAVAVPLLALLPWIVADWGTTLHGVARYRGVPGQGGLSLLVQPDLAQIWIGGVKAGRYSDASRWLADHGAIFTALGAALAVTVTALAARRRLGAPETAVLVLLALLATGPNLLYQYTIWILPFALMAGWLGPAAVLQTLGAISGFMIALGTRQGAPSPWGRGVVYGVYLPVTALVWLCFVGALVYGVRRLLARPPLAGAAPA